MKINIHAGHNPFGKVACGAVGLIDESFENRRVKDEVIRLLRNECHIVYDCTVWDGISANDVLKRIVDKCNSHNVDLDISIHFNAGARELADGHTTGTEVLVYGNTSNALPYAIKIAENIARLGFKNRGVKARPDLYVLNKTKAPALLIECCFVDDPDDVSIYDCNKMAIAIASAIDSDINRIVSTDNVVARFQAAYNKDFNGNLTVDGKYGPKTDFAMRNVILKANVDIANKIVKVGSTGELVKLVQELLGIEADGKFGKGTRTAAISYQGKNRLAQDGVVGYNTFCKLIKH